MQFALFYVWEVARVWAHWIHSFVTHLNFIRPAFCFSLSWIPSGCIVDFSSWGLAASSPFVSIPNQSILKEISPEYSLEGLMLKPKLQYFGRLMWRLIGKDPGAGKDWRQEEKGAAEDEMVGWHYWLDGHEFEQTLEDREGQGSLACYSLWGHTESDVTELT